MRSSYDPRTLWVLSGIAVRIGQRLGLHRDGASLGLPVFEVEMRRRLSWQIVTIDGRGASEAGQGSLGGVGIWDMKIPSNLNDSDLDPNMREAPLEHTGPTEMIFCLVRYTAGDYFRASAMLGAFDGNWQTPTKGMQTAGRDKQIDEVEAILEHKFIRYCDPVIPLHFLAAAVARGVVYSMRVMAHHPRQQPDQGVNMSQEEKDLLFVNSLRMVEYANLAYSTKSMKKYLWHIGSHFQWHAFIYVLADLRFRRSGEESDRAWRQVEEVFRHYPQILANKNGNFHTAIGRLALRAWEAREAELRRQYPNFTQPQPPSFIGQLYSHRGASKTANPLREPLCGELVSGPESMLPDHGQTSSNFAHTSDSNIPESRSYIFSASTPMDLTPIDWAEWDSLVQDFELQGEDTLGQEIFG